MTIVTSSTLLGLTSINGSYELHAAMLIMLLWRVRVLRLPTMPIGHSVDEVHMDPGTMYYICIATHAFLFCTTFMVQSPSVSNSVLLQIASFAGLGLYIFMQAKCAIEIYDARPLSWMGDEDTVTGTVWLKVELATFTGTILCNILFMFLRSLREPSLKIDLVDKKK